MNSRACAMKTPAEVTALLAARTIWIGTRALESLSLRRQKFPLKKALR